MKESDYRKMLKTNMAHTVPTKVDMAVAIMKLINEASDAIDNRDWILLQQVGAKLYLLDGSKCHES